MKLKSSELKSMGLVLKDGVLAKEKKAIKENILKKDAPVKKTTRIKESLGRYFFNDGLPTVFEEIKFILDKKRRFYGFDIVPIGKPRMTQSDKWKTDPNHPDPLKRKREVVHRYHTLKNEVIEQANKMGFILGKTFEAIFFIPMPDSWKKTKKDKMNGMPCEEKPDIDNLIKFFLDVLAKEDKFVYGVNCKKHWAYYGSVIVFQ